MYDYNALLILTIQVRQRVWGRSPQLEKGRVELLFLSFSPSKMRRFEVNFVTVRAPRCRKVFVLKNGLEGETPSKIQEPSASVIASLL